MGTVAAPARARHVCDLLVRGGAGGNAAIITVGFFGALVATVLVLVLNRYLLGKLKDSLSWLAVPMDAVPNVTVAIILLAVGVVIGAAGSAIGLRRFLKV